MASTGSHPWIKLPLVLLASALAACGGTGGGSDGTQTRDPQQAFLQSMVPHHSSAVEMARVARTEARTPFVKRLAAEIERSQAKEIAQMRRIHERLFGAPLEPDMGAHMALGLSAEEAGMNHMDGAATIRGKEPFDRAFVDEMVPHHRGAVRMAEALLVRGRDPELRRLAEDVVAAQRREIRAMNAFRERRYGAPVPAAPQQGRSTHSG